MYLQQAAYDKIPLEPIVCMEATKGSMIHQHGWHISWIWKTFSTQDEYVLLQPSVQLQIWLNLQKKYTLQK
jgi:hypothetical protein